MKTALQKSQPSFPADSNRERPYAVFRLESQGIILPWLTKESLFSAFSSPV
jgi:hypothetical protein